MEENDKHTKIVDLVKVPKGEVTLAQEVLRVLAEQEKQKRGKAADADDAQLTLPF